MNVDLTSIIHHTLRFFEAQGLTGLALLVLFFALCFVLAMGYFYHLYCVSSLKYLSQEHKNDKQQLVALVQQNTEAFTRNTAVVENCVVAVNNSTVAIHSCMDLIKEVFQKQMEEK